MASALCLARFGDCSFNSKPHHSFTYSLYVCEYYSIVGASFARDTAKKTLTSVNQNQNQN